MVCNDGTIVIVVVEHIYKQHVKDLVNYTVIGLTKTELADYMLTWI
ncbi:hypothetical protein [Rickettsia sibirica]|nr:hypothetical protein [Rickettsia sibirica]